MSPLELHIMLDLYTTPLEFIRFSDSQPAKNFLHELRAAGIVTMDGDRVASVDGDAVAAFAAAVCSTPLPVRRWQVPGVAQ